MIHITCTKQEQKDISICLAEEGYCVAKNPNRSITCWKCDKDCVKKHINWTITDEPEDVRALQISDAIVDLFKAYGYDVEFLGGQLADCGKWQFCIKEINKGTNNEEEI